MGLRRYGVLLQQAPLHGINQHNLHEFFEECFLNLRNALQLGLAVIFAEPLRVNGARFHLERLEDLIQQSATLLQVPQLLLQQ